MFGWKDEPLELMTPYEELPSLSLVTETTVVDVETAVAEVAVPELVAEAAAAAAITGSFETVLVMIIGSYPGAVTVPPLTTETGAAGASAADPYEEDVVTYTSRIGAPRLIVLVAKAYVYFA
jgi:hypothetical protein